MGLATNESIKDYRDLVEYNQQFKDILIVKGYTFHYHEFIGGHDLECWEATLPKALIYLMN